VPYFGLVFTRLLVVCERWPEKSSEIEKKLPPFRAKNGVFAGGSKGTQFATASGALSA
jgi:hypothetical protein